MTEKKAASPAWTHKGVKIEFTDSNANFVAVVRGKTLRAPSLDAIKKKIDGEQKFEPFDCYVEMTGWGWKAGLEGVAVFLEGGRRGERALIRARAVGIEKPTRSSAQPEYRIEFLDSRGKAAVRDERTVLPRTTEALTAWKRYREAEEAFAQAEHDLEEANKARLTPLHAAVPYRRASEEG